MCVCVCACACVCVHVCVCVCVCVCVHVCMCVCVLFGLLKRERGGEERGVRGSGGVCRRHQRTANQASMHALSDYCRSVPIQELWFQRVALMPVSRNNALCWPVIRGAPQLIVIDHGFRSL